MSDKYQPLAPHMHYRTFVVDLDIIRMRQLMCAWLVFGTLAVLLVRNLRGYNAWIGWLPFWLIAAPLINLLALQLHRLAAQPLRFLVSLRLYPHSVLRRR